MSVKNKLNAFFIKNPPFFDFYFFILNKFFFPIPLPAKNADLPAISYCKRKFIKMKWFINSSLLSSFHDKTKGSPY